MTRTRLPSLLVASLAVAAASTHAAGAFAQMRATTTHDASAAPSSGAPAVSRRIAVSPITHCGRVAPGANRHGVDQCVVEAFRAHRAFVAVYETRESGGTVLSEQWEGTAGGTVTLTHQLVITSPGGPTPTPGQIPCDRPTVVNNDGAIRLMCSPQSH
jgi:hypothetical protein